MLACAARGDDRPDEGRGKLRNNDCDNDRRRKRRRRRRRRREKKKSTKKRDDSREGQRMASGENPSSVAVSACRTNCSV